MNDRFKFRAWNSEEERYEDCSVCDGKCISLDTGKGKDWILEQCTGLKDKNGTLIYEGDIIKHHFWKNGYMKWCVSEACFVLAFKDRSPTHQWSYAEVEVIGNIHENEDLLK